MTQPTTPTDSSIQVPFRKFDSFAELSEEGIRKLSSSCDLLRFRVGQPLTSATSIPTHALWILQGECRLLGNEKDRLATLARMGSGACVGLASMLRAAPCEAVTASTEVLAIAVEDKVIVELYELEPNFRKWCDQSIWPAELADLLLRLLKTNAKSDRSILKRLGTLAQTAALLSCNEEQANGDSKSAKQELTLFLASANTELAIGTSLESNQTWPEPRPPFARRVVAIPSKLLKDALQETESSPTAVETNDIPGIKAPELPERGGLDLGQPNPLNGFKLIRGEGDIEETMACFQMLATQMKLPFRRDSIEKILRDSLRRGQKPNLQLCGQLGASLGLHVVGANTPALMGTRLEVPSMITWDNSFAIAIRSDVNGLLLASPSKGTVALKPEELENHFPEGIDILLMERSINTPEQRFGPNWFLPA